jgi:hypothetical protein
MTGWIFSVRGTNKSDISNLILMKYLDLLGYILFADTCPPFIGKSGVDPRNAYSTPPPC